MWNMNDIRLFLSTVQYEHLQLIWWAMPAATVTAVLSLAWWQRRVQAITQYGDLGLVTRFTRLPSLAVGCLTAGGLVSAVVLGFAAATMPYQPLAAVSVPAGTTRFVPALDTSKSMGGENYRSVSQLFGGPNCSLTDGPCGNRLDIAKLLLNQIMDRVKGNQMGLVVYSGGAVTRAFLSDDFAPIRQMLTHWRWVEIGSALGEGSYIDQGLLAAVDVLNHDQPAAGTEPQNIILLFTDSGNDSSPEAMEKAKAAVMEAHAELIIIGLGSDKETAIPIYTGYGRPVYYDGRRAYFEPLPGQSTARNDEAMEKLARDFHGQYVKVIPGQPLAINWPTTLAGTKVVIGKHHLYQYPLAGSVAIIVLIWLGSSWNGVLIVLKGRRRLPFGRRGQSD